MTTSTTARPSIGAGPNPKETTRVIDNRNFERLLTGIKNGTIALDGTYRYRNTRNNADVDDTMWAAEDNGWVQLTPGRPPKVTPAGEKWLADRYSTLGPSPTRPVLLAPDPEAAIKAAKTGAYRGERIHTARLQEEQVREIRRRLSGGEQGTALAREYEVSEFTIRAIRSGTAWRHVA